MHPFVEEVMKYPVLKTLRQDIIAKMKAYRNAERTMSLEERTEKFKNAVSEILAAYKKKNLTFSLYYGMEKILLTDNPELAVRSLISSLKRQYPLQFDFASSTFDKILNALTHFSEDKAYLNIGVNLGL